MLAVLSLGILYLVAPTWTNPIAVGNLAVVIKNSHLISTEDAPLKAHTNDLWCQAMSDKTPVKLTWAKFTRLQDKKQFDAILVENSTKARLVFGSAPVTDAGRYRCEMRTESGDIVFGNMFVNTRPVIHTNGSRTFKVSEHDPTLVEGSEVSAPADSDATIECPVIGYPLPNIVWYKDGLPIEDEGRYTISANSLIISKVQESDLGKYRCVATNKYATVVDGKEQEYELKLEQALTISCYYGWILPLIVIVIILLLVFICIYAWQACSKYNSANYNVARREQTLRREREEEQRRLTKETP